MIEMIIIWIGLPLLLLLISYGVGLAFVLISRQPMSFTLTTVIGFLLMGIIGSLITISPVTAPYTAISFGIISASGLIVSALWFRSHFRFELLPPLAGLLTFFVFSLPAAASGHPTWAGWIKLDDNSSFLAVTDRLMNVGRTVPTPVVSTFDRVIQTFFASDTGGHFSYPVGTFIPFGVVTKLTGVEKAWFYQPYLSFAAALVAMLFVLLLADQITNRLIIVVMASISAMAATVYSYVMWGGIKEIVIVIPLTLFALTFFHALRGAASRAYYLYAAVAFLGILVVGGTASIGYIAPIVLTVVLIKLWTKNHTYFYLTLGSVGVIAVALILLLRAGNKSITHLFIPIIGDTGNLVRPLNMAQLFGIWPSQDFRLEPVFKPLTFSIIGLAFVFVIAGLYFSIKRGEWVVPTLIFSCLAVVAASYFWGGIWLTGKAIAVASPIFLLAASIGIHILWIEAGQGSLVKIAPFRSRALIVLLAILVASGVIVSDFYTYKNVWLAPFSEQDELRYIGETFAGQGPALMTEYSVYGSRYFLRNLDAEAVSELRVHLIPTRDGNQVPRGYAADIDLFNPATIDYYNLLVLRKSANASRPPLDYNLTWSGEHYDVWKKVPGVNVKATLPLGSIFYPGAVPTCAAVTSFLAQRTDNERIYTAIRSKDYVIDFAAGPLPSNWSLQNSYTGGVHVAGAGAFNRNFTVDATQNYTMWVAGSYPGRLRILIDGRQEFSGGSIFEANQFLTNPVGSVELSQGAHVVTIIYDTPKLMPGSDSTAEFGPLYLSSQTASDVKVREVPISGIPHLCTQNLDWIAIAD